jgi:hypothetical protein
MARLIRLLLLGLLLAAGAAGCKKAETPATAPLPLGQPRPSPKGPKPIPLPP